MAPAATTAHTATMRDSRRESGELQMEHPKETRRAFKTTELFVLLASVAGVLVVGYAGDDALNVWRIWMLVTILCSAYMVSRGIAKAGSYERRSDFDIERNRG